MARTTQWTPRRVRNEEDRNTGSAGFIDLSEGENFLGYALFEGDPSKDEPGYYEYMQHWVPSAKGGSSVPCAGDNCPFCEEGDKPRDVAYTAWLVTKDPKGNTLGKEGEGEVLAFRANSIVIKQITEMRAEDESPRGLQFRVSRLDDRGNYILASKPKAPLKVTAIKTLLKDAGIDFDGMVTNRLRKAMEGIAVARALDDDDDDDNGAAPAKRGKPAAGKAAKSSGDEWPAKTKGLDVTVESIDDDGNFIMVESDDYDGPAKVWTTPDIDFDLETLEEGQEITVAYTTDADDDFVLSSEPVLAEEEAEEEEAEEDEAPAADNDLPDELEDEEFEVVSIDKTNSTMDVKSDALDLEFTLYFLDRGPAGNVDFDDYEEGNTIVVSAEKDTVGDMVATVVPTLKEAPAKRKPATRRKTAAAPAGKGRAR
jgi:ribosomal protein L12E/L44/L45/RPP1/RPP2